MNWFAAAKMAGTQLTLGGNYSALLGFGGQSLCSFLAHSLDQGVMARTTHMIYKLVAKFSKPGIAIQYCCIDKARRPEKVGVVLNRRHGKTRTVWF